MNRRIRKKKGLSKITNEEVWGLDITLAKYILPRLIKFKTINTMSRPSEFKNLEEWHNVIDKMIWSFDEHLKNDFPLSNSPDFKEQVDRYEEGLQLFAKHFGDLWD